MFGINWPVCQRSFNSVACDCVTVCTAVPSLLSPPPFILLLSVIASLTKWKRKKRMWFAFQITRSAFAAHLPVYNEVLYIGTLPFFFSIRRRLRTFVYTLCAPLFYGEKDHVLLCNLESPLSARAGAAFHPFIWHPIVCVHVFLLTPKSWQVKC